MANYVYDCIHFIFGSGLVDELSDWMTELWSAIWDIFMHGSFVSNTVNLYAGIACALLSVYFFMDIYGQVSRDMFTFEKLIVSLLRLMMAFAILLSLEDILKILMKIGYYMYQMCSEDSFATTLFGGAASTTTAVDISEITLENLQKEYTVTRVLTKHMGVVLMLLIPSILAFIAKIVGMFICASNAVMIVARAAFSPIAVVQVFEEGTRSAGIRYLKKFVADCCTMAGICVILLAVSMITQNLDLGLEGEAAKLTVDNLESVITFGNMTKILIPSLIQVGCLASGSKLIHDVVGAQ